MPTKSKAKPKRRRMKRKMTGGALSTYSSSVPTSLIQPFPNHYTAKLRYCENTIVVTGVLGVPTSLLWYMNNLFDPRVALGGHQPYGFDQLSAIYNRYRVHRMDYQIDFECTGISQNICHGFISLTNDSAAISSNYEYLVERNNVRTIGLNTNSKATLRGSVDLAKFNGCKPIEYITDDRYQASITGGPSEIMCIHVGAETTASAVATSIGFQVLLTYHTEFFDTLELPQS